MEPLSKKRRSKNKVSVPLQTNQDNKNLLVSVRSLDSSRGMLEDSKGQDSNRDSGSFENFNQPKLSIFQLGSSDQFPAQDHNQPPLNSNQQQYDPQKLPQLLIPDFANKGQSKVSEHELLQSFSSSKEGSSSKDSGLHTDMSSSGQIELSGGEEQTPKPLLVIPREDRLYSGSFSRKKENKKMTPSKLDKSNTKTKTDNNLQVHNHHPNNPLIDISCDSDSFANSKASGVSRFKKMGTQVERSPEKNSLQLPIMASGGFAATSNDLLKMRAQSSRHQSSGKKRRRSSKMGSTDGSVRSFMSAWRGSDKQVSSRGAVDRAFFQKLPPASVNNRIQIQDFAIDFKNINKQLEQAQKVSEMKHFEGSQKQREIFGGKGKRLYSKNMFEEYSSLRSVVKPRLSKLIHEKNKEEQQNEASLVQQHHHSQQMGQSQEKKLNQLVDNNVRDHQSEIDFWRDSDSESIFSNVQSFLETSQDQSASIDLNNQSLILRAPPKKVSWCQSIFCCRGNGCGGKNASNKVQSGADGEDKSENGAANDEETRKSSGLLDGLNLSLDEEFAGQVMIKGPCLTHFPNKNFFIVHGRMINHYTPNSLNQMGFDDPIRQRCIWLAEWPWFDRIVIFAILVNSLMLGFIDYVYQNTKIDQPDLEIPIPLTNRVMEQSELVFTIIFTVECLVKIIAMGLIIDQSCYLRDPWNWIDFTVVVGSILSYLPGVYNVAVLRTFRLFRPLRSLKRLPSMKVLVQALMQSIFQLTNIFMLLAFSLLLFAILGLQTLKGVTHYRCREAEGLADGMWPVVEGDLKVCGGMHQCSEGQICVSLSDPVLKKDLYALDQTNLYHAENIEELNWNLTNFDNIMKAFITMFQATTLEGWYKIMTIFKDGYNQYITSIFFLLAIQICHYLLVNLTLAVMVHNLENQKRDEIIDLVNRKHELSFSVKEKRKALNISASLKMTSGEQLKAFCGLFLNTFCVFNFTKLPPQRRYDYNLISFLWHIAEHSFFTLLFVILVLINLWLVGLEQYDPADHEDTKSAFFLVVLNSLNFLFLCEMIIKLLAYDFKEFRESRLNILDVLINVLFLTLFTIDCVKVGKFVYSDFASLPLTSRFSFFSAMRAFRLVNVARRSKQLRILLDCIVFTIDNVGNFIILIVIFIYVFSLLGMQFFAGRLRFDTEGNRVEMTSLDVEFRTPRSNFDDFLTSILTVVQILLGERWNEVFYDCQRGRGFYIASLYFIITIFMGNIIMMNLFLAMLLGNFQRASLISQVKIQEEQLHILEPTIIANKNKGRDTDQMKAPQSILKKQSRFDKKHQSLIQRKISRNLSLLSPQKFGNEQRSWENNSPLNSKKRADSSFNSDLSLDEVQKKNEENLTDRLTSSPDYLSDPSHQNYNENLGLHRRNTIFNAKDFEGTSDEPPAEFFQPPKNYFNYAKINQDSQQKQQLSPSAFLSPAKQQKSSSLTTHLSATNNQDLLTISPSTVKKSSSKIQNQQTPLNIIKQNKFFAVEEEEEAHCYQRSQSPFGQCRRSNANINNMGGVSLGNLARWRNSDKQSRPRGASYGTGTGLSPQPGTTAIAGAGTSGDASPLRLASPIDLFQSQRRNSVLVGISRKFNSGAADHNSSETLGIVSDTDGGASPIAGMLHQQQRRRQGLRVAFSRQLTVETKGSKSKYFQELMKQEEVNAQKRRVKKRQALKKRQEAAQINIEEEEQVQPPIAERIKSKIAAFIPNASLFCFHKHSSFRRFCIDLTIGWVNQPRFTTVDELYDYYTQKVSPAENEGDQYIEKSHSSEEDDLSDDDIAATISKNNLIYKSQMQKFFEDPNSSAFVEEVIRTQKDKNFDAVKLREQVGQIKDMQDGGKYDNIFQGSFIKNGGQFYLSSSDYNIKIYYHKWYNFLNKDIFSFITNICVLLSSLSLALDNPFSPADSNKSQFIRYLDIFFTLIFSVEVIVKVVALGLCTTSLKGKERKSYLQDPWNVLDLIVVLNSYAKIIIDFFFSVSAQSAQFFSGAKSLRLLRSLRPLRLVSRFQSLRIAMNTVLTSLPQLLNVILISSIVVTVFSIFGLNLMKGCLYHCVIDGDHELARTDSRIDTKQDCLDLGYQWENSPNNFDDLVGSTLMLIVFMTNENWVNAMHEGMDSRGYDLQPKRNANKAVALFFLSYLIVGHVLIANLFVGVICGKFQTMNDYLRGYHGQTFQKRDWIDIQKLMVKQKLRTKWYMPQMGLQSYLARFCASKHFEIFIMLIIVLNVVLLAMPFHGQSDEYAQTLDIIQQIFNIIYNVEAALKILGLRKRYFSDSWNVLDFVIVISSDIGELIAYYFGSLGAVSSIIVVVRALRVARIFKIVKGMDGLKVLLTACQMLFQNLLNISGLLWLLVFIYAVLGMNLFHGVMLQDNYNESTNFRSFTNSIFTLIRCLTGEGWNLILTDLTLQGTYKGVQCVENQSFDDWQNEGVIGCGSPIFAYLFFFSFVSLSQFVFINLFIAFVLQAYKMAFKERASLITYDDYESLINCWSDYDPKATGMIDPQDVVFLIYQLSGNLGKKDEYQDVVRNIIKDEDEEDKDDSEKCLTKAHRYVIKTEMNMILPSKIVIETLASLKLPIYLSQDGHKCHFKDVCIQLTKQALININFAEEDDELEEDKNLLYEWQMQYDVLRQQIQLEDQDSGRFWAGLFIARLIKQMQERRAKKGVKSKVTSISEINIQREYSKMLRQLEAKEKEEEEMKALAKKRGVAYRQGSTMKKGVHFDMGDEESEDNQVYLQEDLGVFSFLTKDLKTQQEIDQTKSGNTFKNFDAQHDNVYDKFGLKEQQESTELMRKTANQVDGLMRNRRNSLTHMDSARRRKKDLKKKDYERSLWWLRKDQEGSSAPKIQKWIEINDIRYGKKEYQDKIKEENNKQNSQYEANSTAKKLKIDPIFNQGVPRVMANQQNSLIKDQCSLPPILERKPRRLQFPKVPVPKPNKQLAPKRSEILTQFVKQAQIEDKQSESAPQIQSIGELENGKDLGSARQIDQKSEVQGSSVNLITELKVKQSKTLERKGTALLIQEGIKARKLAGPSQFQRNPLLAKQRISDITQAKQSEFTPGDSELSQQRFRNLNFSEYTVLENRTVSMQSGSLQNQSEDLFAQQVKKTRRVEDLPEFQNKIVENSASQHYFSSEKDLENSKFSDSSEDGKDNGIEDYEKY